MDRDTFPRLIGYALLGALAGGLLLAVARDNDQKRIVGYEPGRSLEVACTGGTTAVFTNGERQAVFMTKPDGKVAAQPVFRGGPIAALDCDARRKEVVVTTAAGEHRVRLALWSQVPACPAATSQSTKAMIQGLCTDSGASTTW